MLTHPSTKCSCIIHFRMRQETLKCISKFFVDTTLKCQVHLQPFIHNHNRSMFKRWGGGFGWWAVPLFLSAHFPFFHNFCNGLTFVSVVSIMAFLFVIRWGYRYHQWQCAPTTVDIPSQSHSLSQLWATWTLFVHEQIFKQCTSAQWNISSVNYFWTLAFVASSLKKISCTLLLQY